MALILNRRSLLPSVFGLAAFSLAKQAHADLASSPSVPPIDDSSSIIGQLLYSTVRVESRGPETLRFGTGLIFTFLANAPYLVTARQLLADASSCRLMFTAATPNGTPDPQVHVSVEVNDLQKGVIGHPAADADLAIFPLGPLLREMQDMNKLPFFRSVAPNIIPTTGQLQALAPYQELLILSYPGQLWDTLNNLPVMMHSTTATPASLDYNGKREFLINARALPGVLGSPVFAYNRQSPSEPSSYSSADWIYLVGIMSGAAVQRADGQTSIELIPMASGRKPSSLDGCAPIDLTVCLNASRILEFEPLLRQSGIAVSQDYQLRAVPPEISIKK